MQFTLRATVLPKHSGHAGIAPLAGYHVKVQTVSSGIILEHFFELSSAEWMS
jgi:hypothetical protein